MAFGLLGLFGIVLVAYVRLAAETRITPYVVEVDRLGRAVAFGPAEQAAITDPRIVEATLSLFIRNVRAVSSDGVVERELLYRAYATRPPGRGCSWTGGSRCPSTTRGCSASDARARSRWTRSCRCREARSGGCSGRSASGRPSPARARAAWRDT